jgi:hypothetical protein
MRTIFLVEDEYSLAKTNGSGHSNECICEILFDELSSCDGTLVYSTFMNFVQHKLQKGKSENVSSQYKKIVSHFASS